MRILIGTTEAATLASEFKRLEIGLAKWDSRTVLIVDEAAMGLLRVGRRSVSPAPPRLAAETRGGGTPRSPARRRCSPDRWRTWTTGAQHHSSITRMSAFTNAPSREVNSEKTRGKRLLGEIALEQKSRSVTAEGVAIQRALHQTLDAAPKILDDPISPLLLDLASESNKAYIARVESLTRPVKSPFRAVFIMRSRFAEDCLAESLVRGVLQYVILGAGLDTFAYRQPPWAGSLRIYEVDHPASQDWKRERLEVANVKVPKNLIFAPIDFETTSLREGLSASGFDFRFPSFFSLLGVTQYLTAEAIESILRLAQSLPSGSEIVFELIVPDDLMPTNEAAVFAAIASVAAERGEPWLTRLRPEEVTSMLLTLGFSKVTHLSPQGADERYFRGRSDDLAAWSGAQMMRAIV